VKESEE